MKRLLTVGSVLFLFFGLSLCAPSSAMAAEDPVLRLQVQDCNWAPWTNTPIVFLHYRNDVIIETITDLSTNSLGFVNVTPGMAPKEGDVCRVAFSVLEIDGERAREFLFHGLPGPPAEDYSWHPNPDPGVDCVRGDCCTTKVMIGGNRVWQIRIPR